MNEIEDSKELMNHDVIAQRLTSAHPLSFWFWTGGDNAEMLKCLNAFFFNSAKIASALISEVLLDILQLQCNIKP